MLLPRRSDDGFQRGRLCCQPSKLLAFDFLGSLVYGIFLVDFHKFTIVVINLLVEAESFFACLLAR
jgi:hypothetical protein